MGNPYAARVSRHAAIAETVGELDQFLGRLRALGATDDEIATVRDTWDELDPEWTAEQRTALTLLPDDELRAELVATREEYRHDTRTEQDQADIDASTHLAAVRREAADLIGRSVAHIRGWVGEDAVRAIAVLDLEMGPDGARRVTLMKPLQEILDPAPTEGIPVEVLAPEVATPVEPGMPEEPEKSWRNPTHFVELGEEPDLDADELIVDRGVLPDAAVGDFVGVTGPSENPIRFVAVVDDFDEEGDPILHWAEAVGDVT